MPRKTLRRACAVLCMAAALGSGLLFVTPADADGPDVWAITGATIVPASGPHIERGTIVIRDGLIAEVGSSVQVPADARILDGSGLTVYPGIIDAFSVVEEPQQPGADDRRGPRQQQQQLPDRNKPEGVSPTRNALDTVTPGRYESIRNIGITSFLAVPKGGVFRGQSALVNVVGESAEAMSVKTPVALHLAFETQGGFNSYPGSLMGVFAVARQEFLDAQRHKAAWAAYSSDQRGVKRPQPSKDLDSLIPAIERKMPVIAEANADKEIRRALHFAAEFNLNLIIAGGAEAVNSTDALKAAKVPVLLSLNYPTRPNDLDPESYESLKTLKARADAAAVAGKLFKAGVRFAFQSGGLRNPNDLIANAGKAVEAGLPADEAIKALTLYPAQILGVADQLGSLEAGKIANLVVTKGDLFGADTKVRYVFVDGQRFEQKEDTTPKPTGAPAADVSGKWTVTVTTPQGPQQMTLDITQAGSDVRGTLSHPVLGVMDVRSGAIGGDTLRFTVTVDPGGGPVDANFTVKVSGKTFDGTVSLGGQGSYPVSGSKPEGK